MILYFLKISTEDISSYKGNSSVSFNFNFNFHDNWYFERIEVCIQGWKSTSQMH